MGSQEIFNAIRMFSISKFKDVQPFSFNTSISNQQPKEMMTVMALFL